MRLFFAKRVPHFRRVLLVESGSRQLLEDFLPGVYAMHGQNLRLDLVTCYAGAPTAFRPDLGRVYRISDYPGFAGFKRLVQELLPERHEILGIICSDEPIMTKWKWMLAARLPAKVFVLNENCDYFYVDYTNIGTIRHFVLFRLGLSGMGIITTPAKLIALPFILVYLLLYAAMAHLKRWRYTS